MVVCTCDTSRENNNSLDATSRAVSSCSVRIFERAVCIVKGVAVNYGGGGTEVGICPLSSRATK